MATKITLHRYPRGYYALESGSLPGKLGRSQSEKYNFVTVNMDGDKELEELYKLFISRTVNSEGWSFRKKVLGVAARLLIDPKEWFILQGLYNDYIYGLNFDFLVDTWNYIHSGKRDMSPLTWHELLIEPGDEDRKPNSSSIKRLYSFETNSDTTDLYGMWLSKDNGFGDMLCTLHTLFGVARQPLT